MSRRIAGKDVVTALGGGTLGQVLTSNGDPSVPTWKAPAGGDILYVNRGNVAGPNLTLDVSDTKARIVKFTLTGSISNFVVQATPSAPLVFISAMFVITQDGTGSRTIAFPNNFRWQGGFSPSLSTAPGATDVIQIMSVDGATTWLAAVAMQVAA